MKLIDKVAIVTGAGGSGSGRAIARRFAREGASVVIADIREAGSRDTAGAIEAEGLRASIFRTDVGNEDEVRALFAFAENAYGGVDIVVNNASGAVFPERSLDDWFANVRVDLLGAMYATRYGIEAMRRRGGGSIVNIGSTSALPHGDVRSDSSTASGYNTAKAGVIRLTTTLKWLGVKERIRVNCLVPHWIGTEEIKDAIAGMTPEQRRDWAVPDALITPEEVAGATLRLATDENLAGRVMVWFGGQSPQLIPLGDPGYASLDDVFGGNTGR
jgi:NAD(P)-dependent dehydrogenase (short-subunit alcohol dehydrogenase family)